MIDGIKNKFEFFINEHLNFSFILFIKTTSFSIFNSLARLIKLFLPDFLSLLVGLPNFFSFDSQTLVKNYIFYFY